MADKLSLAIERRSRLGTTDARALRRNGRVPAVLYGHGTQPQPIAFLRKEAEDLVHRGGRTSLITLMLDGKRFETALLRDVQIDPVSRRMIHADLQRVSATETVHAKLPVATNGTPAGVRDFGGVMDVLAHEIEVSGPASRLPDRLDVDVNTLGIHDHVIAGDITLPEGFALVTAPETIVVTVEPSKTARLLEEATAAGAPEQAEPELVGGPPEGTAQ